MSDSQPYSGPERRAATHIDDETLKKVATMAADLAVERMTNNAYQAIGKGVVQRVTWVIGLACTALAVWGAQHGWFKP